MLLAAVQSITPFPFDNIIIHCWHFQVQMCHQIYCIIPKADRSPNFLPPSYLLKMLSRGIHACTCKCVLMHTHHEGPMTLPFHYFSALERNLTWVASAPLSLTPLTWLPHGPLEGPLSCFLILLTLKLLLIRYLSLSSLRSRLQGRDLNASNLFGNKIRSGKTT